MKTVSVKDLMIPLDEYATVPKDATLYDAIIALEKALQDFDHKRYPHRAILVYEGKKENVVGKVGQLDVLRALEPKYEKMVEKGGSLARFGFGRQFKKSLLEQYRLWDKPLSDVCRKAAEIHVAEFMYTPGDGEYVEEGITMNEAINQLVMGHHQSLLVTDNKKITGILRLTDVFMAVFDEIRTGCDPKVM